MPNKKPTFCYSILQESLAYANIVVYMCAPENFEHMRKALHQYSKERGIRTINVTDYMENDYQNIDDYIDKKVRDGIAISDPSFKHGNSN